eukprot:13839030-Ditylum_brightwellii.AAC.1
MKKSGEDLEKLGSELDRIIIKEDFVQHCKEIAGAVFDKYKAMHSNQHVKKAKRAFMTGKVFDILYLQDSPDTDVLKQMVDELSSFGFVELKEPQFINWMKSE